MDTILHIDKDECRNGNSLKHTSRLLLIRMLWTLILFSYLFNFFLYFLTSEVQTSSPIVTYIELFFSFHQCGPNTLYLSEAHLF